METVLRGCPACAHIHGALKRGRTLATRPPLEPPAATEDRRSATWTRQRCCKCRRRSSTICSGPARPARSRRASRTARRSSCRARRSLAPSLQTVGPAVAREGVLPEAQGPAQPDPAVRATRGAGAGLPAGELVDQRETIVLDYSKTSVLAHYIRDEIREVAPNLYLGIVYWGHTKTINFALDFAHQHR